MKRLSLCLPLYSRQVDIAVARRFFLSNSHQVDIDRHTSQSSLLAHGFNKQWLVAIAGNYDYFLMLHSDVEPVDVDWVDIMLRELHTVGADILSVVIPIKDSRGQTSTAIGQTQWGRTRLNLSQIRQLPPTFCAADCLEHDSGDKPLLINTGCMLVRLDRSWVRKVRFEINDRIEDGKAECEPEDWSFSRQAWNHGASIYATTAVKVYHHGVARYPNWITDV